MKGKLSNFQAQAHARQRKLLVLLVFVILVLCFTITPIQSNALETCDNGLENSSPMTVIPEFNQLTVDFERDYLYNIANFGEQQYHFKLYTDFDVHNNLIFHAAGNDGLLIYDTTNPQDLKLIAQEKDFQDTDQFGEALGYHRVCYSEGYVYA